MARKGVLGKSSPINENSITKMSVFYVSMLSVFYVFVFYLSDQ